MFRYRFAVGAGLVDHQHAGRGAGGNVDHVVSRAGGGHRQQTRAAGQQIAIAEPRRRQRRPRAHLVTAGRRQRGPVVVRRIGIAQTHQFDVFLRCEDLLRDGIEPPFEEDQPLPVYRHVPNSPPSSPCARWTRARSALDEAWALFISRLVTAANASTKARTDGARFSALLLFRYSVNGSNPVTVSVIARIGTMIGIGRVKDPVRTISPARNLMPDLPSLRASHSVAVRASRVSAALPLVRVPSISIAPSSVSNLSARHPAFAVPRTKPAWKKSSASKVGTPIVSGAS